MNLTIYLYLSIQNIYKSFYSFFIFCMLYLNTYPTFADTFTYILLPTESIELPISTSQPISVQGKSKIKVTSHTKNYQVKAVQTGQVFYHQIGISFLLLFTSQRFINLPKS